ncbi:hypothetical protein [Nocardioides zhouii]|uniref:hypothetical protein n=1 Tax=Nocardioides zhouii TaxID=1168729 RepID=UPI0013EDCC3E|nr:hypothetical protein [Nocardioides zhouii]
MRKQRNDDSLTWDVAGRIKALEQFTGSLVARRAEADGIPINEAPPTRVPEPRHSRIFLRGAEGFGAYSDLTVTAPAPRPAMD